MTFGTAAKGADERYCADCGSIIKARAEICPKCGVRQLPPPAVAPVPVASPAGPNKLVAALLAIFLGTFGVHKFYLGKIFQGVLYLLFFWTGIPTLVGFIEGIIYLAMSEAVFAHKYGYAR